MRLNHFIRSFFSAVMVLFLWQATASETNMPDYTYRMEYLRLTSPWFQSANPASLFLAGIPDAGLSHFLYSANSGAFHRPQQAESVNQAGFYSERVQSLKNLRFKGHFNFLSINETNRQWSNVLDPFSGNPYQYASEKGGDWKAQFYNMGFTASSNKLFNLFYFGLDVDYSTRTGARQNDPRPLNNGNQLEIKPGFIIPLGDHSGFGLMAFYANRNEEISISVSNTDEQQRWFRTQGLAEYRTGLSISGNRAYYGETYGGGLQYILNRGQLSLMASAAMKLSGEEATDGISTVQHGGEFRQTRTEGSIFALNRTPVFNHLLRAHFRLDQREGIEHNQSFDNRLDRWITFATTRRFRGDHMYSGIQYSLFRNHQATDYKWMAGLSADFSSDDSRYLIPASFLEVQSLEVAARGAKVLGTGSNRFHLNMSAGYKLVLDHDIKIHPEVYSSGRTVIADNVLTPDYEFLTTDQLIANAGISYFRHLPKSATQFWLQLNLGSFQPLGKESASGFLTSGRNHFEVKLGLLY